jgi:glycosyltransferase involved in cell wall biosynthesis
MYCGSCLRDNALVAALRLQGHTVTMIPLYLPLKTDEADQSAGTPVFFGGINVYLEQHVPLFRRLPRWLHDALDSPRLLRWVGGAASRTRPAALGPLTVSMLKGEDGNQARELDELVQWMDRHEHPDVISLSNALLAGCARRLKGVLGSIVAVTLQGEDAFLDALESPHREIAWRLVAERLSEVDLITAPSRYYADHMADRTGLPRHRIQVVRNGISLPGWSPALRRPDPPVVGFLARMTPE